MDEEAGRPSLESTSSVLRGGGPVGGSLRVNRGYKWDFAPWARLPVSCGLRLALASRARLSASCGFEQSSEVEEIASMLIVVLADHDDRTMVFIFDLSLIKIENLDSHIQRH